MRWNTCYNLDKGQNLITTDAPALSIVGVVGGESGAKLIGVLKFIALLKVYKSEDLLHSCESLEL